MLRHSGEWPKIEPLSAMTNLEILCRGTISNLTHYTPITV